MPGEERNAFLNHLQGERKGRKEKEKTKRRVSLRRITFKRKFCVNSLIRNVVCSHLKTFLLPQLPESRDYRHKDGNILNIKPGETTHPGIINLVANLQTLESKMDN